MFYNLCKIIRLKLRKINYPQLRIQLFPHVTLRHFHIFLSLNAGMYVTLHFAKENCKYRDVQKKFTHDHFFTIYWHVKQKIFQEKLLCNTLITPQFPCTNLFNIQKIRVPY